MISIFRADKKSPAFQRELYHLHYKRIYNICLRIIGNSMDAEEAMHDTFLKLFDHIDELQDEKAFYSWSQKIAMRTSIDRVRKKRVVFEPVDNLAIVEEEPVEEERMTLSVDAVKQELNNLPDGYRVIVSMRLFEECEFEEIARLLNIKESTVRSQFIRGKAKLAQRLTQVNMNRINEVYIN